MAEENRNPGTPPAAPSSRGGAELFKLNARYLIDPNSKPEDVGEDVACMHEALNTVLQEIIGKVECDNPSTLGLAYTALYLAQQTQGMAAMLAAHALRHRNDGQGAQS